MRLHKTLADYLVIAVSPVLIMLLVGSLVFFLLEVFYRGHWTGRLEYIMGLFVMATVLIGRISIEEGMERAVGFAIPLALVSLVAINRFVQFQGALAGLSGFINSGLLGLVWWSSHRLTWDCTVIDEREDDSGEGLLQTVGLDTGGRPPRSEVDDGARQLAIARRRADNGEDLGSIGDNGAEAEEEPEGVTSRDAPQQSWWQRWVERSRRPHAPGVWVVYFSLAALPLFGVGQMFIPSADAGAKQAAFKLLCVYVASGLGLLLTTSFLGLRRYLRQRRLEMPVEMAATWIAMGSLLIVGIMAFAAILPRPNAEYALAEMSLGVDSPEQKPSRYGVGNDGVRDDQGKAGAKPESGEEPNAAGPGEKDEQATGGKKQEQSGGGEQGKPRQEGGKKQDSQGKSDGGQKTGEQSQQEEQTQQGQRNQSQRESQSSEAKDGDRSQESRQQQDTQTDQGNRQDSRKQSHESQPPDSQQPQQQKPSGSDADKAKPAESQAQKNRQQQLRDLFKLPRLALGQWFLLLLKWTIWIVLLAVVIYWLWTRSERVREFFRQLAAMWAELLAWLSGKRRPAEGDTAETPAETGHRPFSAYPDPFLTGHADEWPIERLVRYSFEALEAWARENGCPRRPEQTPHEFAEQIAAQVPSLAREARRLAGLYSRVAYARGRLPAANVELLRTFWHNIPTIPPVAFD